MVQIQPEENRDDFRINTFYTIIDILVSELKMRSEAYNNVLELFGFLCELLNISSEEIKIKAKKLVKTYVKDLHIDIIQELEHFISLLNVSSGELFFSQKNTLIPLKVLNWIVDNDYIEVFPNIYIAYRLFVTIPIANCETERSFSVLKRIKNMYRSTTSDTRPSAWALLSIESELLKSISFEEIITKFATEKSRKKF
ncbi:hypothetical protein TKK_0005804 [Trichogramma kaykai]